MLSNVRNSRVNISGLSHVVLTLLARRFGIKKGDVIEVLLASAIYQNHPKLAEEIDRHQGTLASAASYDKFQVEVKIVGGWE